MGMAMNFDIINNFCMINDAELNICPIHKFVMKKFLISLTLLNIKTIMTILETIYVRILGMSRGNIIFFIISLLNVEYILAFSQMNSGAGSLFFCSLL
jgi:hypothetical protein